MTGAVRDALDRQQLLRGLVDLDDEHGPLDDDLIAASAELFERVETANRRAPNSAARTAKPVKKATRASTASKVSTRAGTNG